jgi:hypothetical protein
MGINRACITQIAFSRGGLFGLGWVRLPYRGQNAPLTGAITPFWEVLRRRPANAPNRSH